MSYNIQHSETGALHLTHPEGAVGSEHFRGPTPDLSKCLGADWRINLVCMFWWWGKQSTRRKPTQEQGEYANCAQKGPCRDLDLLAVKLTKPHYLLIILSVHFWDITFRRIVVKQVRWSAPLTFEGQSLIRSPLSPSGCLCQIWIWNVSASTGT